MVMASISSQEKPLLKKGAWSTEEDRKLISYIERYGIWNWSHMAKPAGLARSGKSCRFRWLNYLRPGIKRGHFSREEEDTILKLHAELGNRWSAIAAKLPGRSDSKVKSHWHAHLKKRLNSPPPPSQTHTSSQVGKLDEVSCELRLSLCIVQTDQSDMALSDVSTGGCLPLD